LDDIVMASPDAGADSDMRTSKAGAAAYRERVTSVEMDANSLLSGLGDRKGQRRIA